MPNPDNERFHVQVQKPELIFQVARHQLDDPTSKGVHEIASADLGSLTTHEGLFSKIETSLALYYPKDPVKRDGFILFTLAEYSTNEQSYWSNSHISRLQAQLRGICQKQGEQEVRRAETRYHGRVSQHLFIFDRSLGLRLHTSLGTTERQNYHPGIKLSTSISLDAGSTLSLRGSPDHIIPFDQEEHFICRIQRGSLLLAQVINEMSKIKGVPQLQTLTLSVPDRFVLDD